MLYKKHIKNYIIILIILLSVGSSMAEEQIKWSKNGTQTFLFLDSPLIGKITGYYALNDSIIGGAIDFEEQKSQVFPVYGIFGNSDSNVSIKYRMRIKKIMPGIGYKDGPVETYNKSTDKLEVTGAVKNDEWIKVPAETELASPTNAYLNKVSTQVDLLVDYEVLDANVNYLTPFVFELGDWPKYINNIPINELLKTEIYDNNLLIYGNQKVVIFSKTSDLFNYMVIEKDNSYYLQIQKKIESEETNKLNVYFRPVTIKSEILNLEVLAPTQISDSLKVMPEISFDISNDDIKELKVSYLNSKNKMVSDKLSANGNIIFNKMISTEGKKIWYPFDSYSATIFVEPPLLNTEDEGAEVSHGSVFTGKIQSNYNEIKIVIRRNYKEQIDYFIPLLAFFIIFLIATIFKQNLFYYIDLFIGFYIIWYISRNIGYINSVGSLIATIVFTICTWIFLNRNAIID